MLKMHFEVNIFLEKFKVNILKKLTDSQIQIH